MIEYNLVRSNRKSMAIHITKDAMVEVRAPLKMSKPDIDRFILAKEKWINDHLSIRMERNKIKAEFTLNIGDMVLLQGNEYHIKTIPTNRVGFDGTSFYVPENLNSNEIKYAVVQIYKMVAKKILIAKTASFANQMGVTPRAIKINSAKTHWGSCSAKNDINFSWMLVLADDTVIDYVVVHELAHIKELNHSDRFWGIVEAVLPDYKLRQQQLKLLQEKLSKEDWS